MPHDTYESPLAARNASAEMLRLFSSQHKFGLWRRLWLQLARCQHELGISRLSQAALSEREAHLDDIDFDRAADWEKRLRHDVMAHVHTFEEAAPAAKGIIHLGATSQYVVDNADLVIMRDAMKRVAQALLGATAKSVGGNAHLVSGRDAMSVVARRLVAGIIALGDQLHRVAHDDQIRI